MPNLNLSENDLNDSCKRRVKNQDFSFPSSLYLGNFLLLFHSVHSLTAAVVEAYQPHSQPHYLAIWLGMV